MNLLKDAMESMNAMEVCMQLPLISTYRSVIFLSDK